MTRILGGLVLFAFALFVFGLRWLVDHGVGSVATLFGKGPKAKARELWPSAKTQRISRSLQGWPRTLSQSTPVQPPSQNFRWFRDYFCWAGVDEPPLPNSKRLMRALAPIVITTTAASSNRSEYRNDAETQRQGQPIKNAQDG